MKNYLLIISLLFFSAFVFSACTVKKNESANNFLDETSVVVPTGTGNDTEDSILKELNAENDPDFSTDFKNLETELSP